MILDKTPLTEIDPSETVIYKYRPSYEELEKENERLKKLYKRTCKHLFNIGNDELARYFQAQISECNVFTTQGKSDE